MAKNPKPIRKRFQRMFNLLIRLTAGTRFETPEAALDYARKFFEKLREEDRRRVDR
jgi:hypothetical protein